MTASLHVDFTKPTPADIQLKAIGTVEEIHPEKWEVTTVIFTGDTLCAKGKVVAEVMPDTFTKK